MVVLGEFKHFPCEDEKERFANFLLFSQILWKGPFLYQQCYSNLNLVSAFSHIYGAVCVCACRFPHSRVSRHRQHASASVHHSILRRYEAADARRHREQGRICGLHSEYLAMLFLVFLDFRASGLKNKTY